MTEKSKNRNLQEARSSKKDEFYTQLPDIERELKHYKPHFEGKIVYCNCDDPRVSNFFHYFSHNFEKLGLKKLIATCYKNQDMDLFSRNDAEQAICLVYDGDKSGNNLPDTDEIGITHLKGDGDFRSDECIAILKQADIVVTNPPFSLFREYVAQLMEFDKEFIYKDKQRDAVIDTITKEFPLNVMYWAVREDGKFEVIDGQQRTISICQFVEGDFAFKSRYFHNLQKDEQEQILDYKLMVYFCSGTDSEKLEWFKTINIAGEKLTDQELRNAVYSGPWVTDAKRYFSKNQNIRAFSPNQKREAYERQKGKCPVCKETFDIDAMEADHITPWHEGGKTTARNCQMLCKEDNRRKSGT